MALEIFKLFGTIMVNNDEANESISATEGKAEGLGGKLLSGIGTAGKWAAGIAAAAGTAAIALGTMAVHSADDYNSALNKLQVQTGATNKEMGQLGEVVKNVYGDNFGESFDDVANSVALVKKNCGLIGEELKSATEKAIGFRDAFGVETEESTRAAKAMMDQFGISADEAFNLMTQGEQKGLDYSGELIDNINEYSVQFGKLGLSANDMFNVFQSGTDAGAFNLDKIGDAVKEFSIRAIDGSNTTIDGFTKLGLNADDMANKFAAGGDTAKDAFYQTIDAINAMQDPVEQSTVGVDLFGTMWEDLGPQVVTQLGSVRDAYDQTKNSADEMNKIQYNSFGEAISGIKRQVETNILIPLGENILPVLNDFANWFATTGVEYISSFSNFISTVFPPIVSFISGMVESILQVVDYALSMFVSSTSDMNLSWSSFMDGLRSIWDSVGKPLFDAIVNIVMSLVTNLAPIFEQIKTLWGILLDYLSVAWNSVGKPLFDFFVNIVNKLAEVFNYVMPIIANVFSGVMNTLKLFWDNIGRPLFEAIGAFVSAVLLPLWQNVFSKIANVVMEVFSAIGGFWNNILKPILDGIILFIGGIFKGDWSQVWDGIKSILKGIWNAIKAVLWDPIKWFIDKVKGVIDAITYPFRKAAEAIGDIWGAIKSKFKLPHFKINGTLNPLKWAEQGMPKIGVDWYYKGGIFTQPTTFGGVGIGDKYNGQGSNPEAVIPLDELWEKLDGIINRPIIVQAGNGRELMRFLAKYQDEFSQYDLGRSVT